MIKKAVTANPDENGGKAAGLLFLKKNGFKVPAFFLIDHKSINEIEKDQSILQKFVDQWKTENKISGNTLWAVRSSAGNEDGTQHSHAGLFKTRLNVNVNQIEQAVKDVLNSYSNENARSYSKKSGAGHGIIIQQMLKPLYSGVIFSTHPLNPADNAVVLNIIPGLGEQLVSGKSSACQVISRNGELSFPGFQEAYSGSFYEGTEIEKIISFAQLKADLSKVFPELIKGIQKLEHLKKHPVEAEFAVEGSALYWLQLRAITTAGEEIIVWDNTASESNYPGLSMPLTISMTRASFCNAYTGMAKFVGMSESQLRRNAPLFANMADGIKGRLYYNVSAWQKLIHQLPFGKKAANALPKLWGMHPALYLPPKPRTSLYIRSKIFIRLLFSLFGFKKKRDNYIKMFESVHQQYEDKPEQKASHEKLIRKYKDIEKNLGNNWEAPLINGFYTMLFFSFLQKIISRSKINELHPNFTNDILFSSDEVVSVTIANSFMQLLKEIQNNTELNDLFNNYDERYILKTLELQFPEFNKQLKHYTDKYGYRSEEAELKMETVSFREDPLLFISYLKKNRGNTPGKGQQKTAFDYKKVLQKTYPSNPFKRISLNYLIRQTIKRVRDRENFRFMRTRSFALVRSVFREIDEHLHSVKLIESRGDSLFLNLEEITTVALSPSYKSIIQKRKMQWSAFAKEPVVTRYLQKGDIFSPEVQANDGDSADFLRGTGCSSGRIIAEVKVIEQAGDETNCEGKILVANYFEPGKLSLFSKSAGIISVRGNLLSHTSILCRELGIPAIVSAKTALKKLKTGDNVEMDGATGTIKILRS